MATPPPSTKKQIDRRRTARLKPPFHVIRVDAELTLALTPDEAPTKMKIQILVNDMTSQGMGIFVNQPLVIGTEIEVHLPLPKKLDFKAKVCWCEEFNRNSHIISEQHFFYRAGIEFLNMSPTTQENLKIFYEEVMRRLP